MACQTGGYRIAAGKARTRRKAVSKNPTLRLHCGNVRVNRCIPVNMEAFLLSTGIVALAEVGDKTQLLALALVLRFRRPWPIVWGILAATLLNHAGAGAAGAWIASSLDPAWLRWILGLSFLAMAVWMLIPDKPVADTRDGGGGVWAIFVATSIAFFFAEIADKTQIATIALAARFDALWAVVAGTTLGMMIANVPVVFFGEAATRKLPVRLVHRITALVLAALGVAVLLADTVALPGFPG